MKHLLLTVLTLASTLSAWAQSADFRSRLIFRGEESVSARVYGYDLSATACQFNLVELTALDPITNKDRKVLLKEYRPTFSWRSTELKTILLMPPTGGENILDWSYANHFCHRGFRVVLLSKWDYQDEASLDPVMHDRGAVRAIWAIRHTVNFIKPTRPKQLGIFGTSVGAISAALGMALDKRIAAGHFIVGGGGMVDIIGSSTEKHLTEFREERMRHFNLRTEGEYKQLLRPKILIDPLSYAKHLRTRPTSHIIARQDMTVPTRNQELLLSESGSKDVLYLDGSHFDVIVESARSQKKRASNFFQRVLQ